MVLILSKSWKGWKGWKTIYYFRIISGKWLEINPKIGDFWLEFVPLTSGNPGFSAVFGGSEGLDFTIFLKFVKIPKDLHDTFLGISEMKALTKFGVNWAIWCL